MITEIQQFLRAHPIFTHQMFVESMAKYGKHNAHTLRNMLAQHVQRGHIVRIRRGLFAAVPYGADAKTYPINPFLITGYFTKEAIIAYRTALAFYGAAYSTSYLFIYLSQRPLKNIVFRNETYQGASFPKSLIQKDLALCYVNTEDIQGMDVRVTSKERTLVDLMDRPWLGGGWEEIWQSLDLIDRLKIDDVIAYALLLENATTIARVGFYLEQRQTELKITQEQLEKLSAHRPVSPHYMSGDRKEESKYIARWNLMVPVSLIKREWEEDLQWESKS